MSTTPTKHLFIAYGSLRLKSSKGYNAHRCGNQVFKRMLTLPGFDLYPISSYPACTLGTGTLICELHEVDDDTFDSISDLELGAGYYAHEVDLPEGRATIYLMKAERLKGREKVESGDWA